MVGFMMLACGGARAQVTREIVAGPMVGTVTDHSARLWIQLSVARKVTVACYEAQSGQPISVLSQDAQGPLPFVCDIALTSLKPSTTYRVELKLDDDPVQVPGPAIVIRTNPAVAEEATFAVGLGSSLNVENGDAGIFDRVMDAKPRAFLFLGNSGLLPEKVEQFPVAHRAAFRFMSEMDSAVRREPGMQALLRTTACYGIWGERDFGGLGAGKDWPFAKESQAVFQRFWSNPGWGTPDNPGCYCTFGMADADFFLLDDRMFRDAEPAAGEGDSGKSMLGDKQLTWLKRGLLASTATFKIIGCNSSLIAPYAHNSWSRYQPEQGDFLKWAAENHISGLLFVSGNGGRGWGELSAIPANANGLGYPLLELSSAGLAGKSAMPGGPVSNSLRALPPVAENNFGTLDFGGVGDHRFVTLRIRDVSGKVRVEQTVFAGQLKGG